MTSITDGLSKGGTSQAYMYVLVLSCTGVGSTVNPAAVLVSNMTGMEIMYFMVRAARWRAVCVDWIVGQ